jgi:peptidoglycan/xylan/chitin deacetylase (PgdA/CDA1 family)
MSEKEQQGLKRPKLASIVAVALLLVGASTLVLASHMRVPAASNPAQVEKMGRFREVDRGPLGKHEIALTFDGGTEADCFDDLMTNLANANVHSTFFVTGRFVNDHPDCAAAITKYGHEIGNHTWSHLALTRESDAVIRDEITRAERRIVEISGQNPRPLWRAPYGDRDARVLKIAASLGYRSIYWTVDSLDGVEPKKTPEFLVSQITTKSGAELDGAIILLHVGIRSTADALPAIISNLQGRGFQLVTISKLLQ